MENNLGSTWNIWDLHVHAPDCILNNQFKNKSWEEYISKLEQFNNVKALGITNYFIMDDFFKVRKYKEEGRLQNIDLILPNIEFRINTFTSRNKGINIHIIFSDDVADLVESHFLNNLKFNSDGRDYYCKKEDLISLGKDIKGNQSMSDKEALEFGTTQFKVNFDDILAQLKSNEKLFKNKYLIGVANSSSDGASGLSESQQVASRRKIYDNCDFIFSGKPSDRKYFLNNNDLKKRLPCIHGSDAHSLDKLCIPDQERYTWIKGELSFEGLKQIKHEPERRIRIQETDPDTKTSYNVINYLETEEDSNKFGRQKICFNPGLNVIIGGKSSGKSILMYKLTQSINNDIINQMNSEDVWNNPYKQTFIEKLPVTTHWKDNSISTVSKEPRQITYIPQMYINALAEKYGTNLLQQKIREIVLKKPQINSYYNDTKLYLESYNSTAESIIEKLQNNLRTITEKREAIQKIGSPTSINQEIKDIESQIEQELENSKISSDENKKITHVKEEMLGLDELINDITSDIQLLNEFDNILNIVSEHMYTKVNEINIKTNDKKIEEFKESYIEAFTDLNSRKKQELESLLIGKRGEKEENKQIRKNSEESIQDIIKKLKRQEIINQLNNKLDCEKNKLKRIDEISNEIYRCEEEFESTINELKSFSKKYFETIKKYADSINENVQTFDGISINSKIEFDQNQFKDNFISQLDKRKLNNDKLTDVIDSEQNFKIDGISEYNNQIDNGINKILEIEENIFKKKHTNISILKEFIKPYLKVTLTLKDGEDSITEMSPGKSGLVILKLLLLSDTETHPILIDQPEDNLDNRTISEELVNLLRKTSLQRQIIIITHNANLAVLTDADNIIIANQDVIGSENENYRFEYINGPLESVNSNQTAGKFYGISIQEHVCNILEGGEQAFKTREKKYNHFS